MQKVSRPAIESYRCRWEDRAYTLPFSLDPPLAYTVFHNYRNVRNPFISGSSRTRYLELSFYAVRHKVQNKSPGRLLFFGNLTSDNKITSFEITQSRCRPAGGQPAKGQHIDVMSPARLTLIPSGLAYTQH